MPARRDSLFGDGELDAVLHATKRALVDDVQDASEKYLLNVELEEWVAHLVSAHGVEPLVIRRDETYLVDRGEKPFDARLDHRMRAITDSSRPAYVPGRAAEIRIPFEGDPALLRLRPNSFTYNPPHAVVDGQELVIHAAWPTDTARPDLAGQAAGLATTVEQWAGWSNAQVAAHNGEVEGIARQAIEARRRRVLQDHAHLDNVGIPVRRRSDAPTTYAAPGVARRQPPRPIARSDPPRAPEPTMVGDLYEHTLSLIRAWTHAAERTPAPWAGTDEETIRDALLPMLNANYEGAATGETFNAAGKTDILIRVEDKTVFIGECKRWSGPKAVGDALEQLFSYSTWRDTKLALIFFVERKDPGAVVTKGRELLEKHELFIGWGSAEDRELRCTMHWPGDPTITAQLHVMFVHFPGRQ